MKRRALLGGLFGLTAGCRRESPAPSATPPPSTAPTARPPQDEPAILVQPDVPYRGGSKHAKHKLDIVRPSKAARAPMVMFLHGGYWVGGDRQDDLLGPPLYTSIGRALAARGLVTVIPSYRLAPEVNVDGMIDDVRHALAWVHAAGQAHGGDPQKLVLMGHSAGGHLAALFATKPELAPTGLRGLIALSAIWDVADMRRRHGAGFHRSVTHPVFGADGREDAARSPLTHVHAGMVPTLLAVGSDDFAYLIPQAERAAGALAVAGVRHRLDRIARHDHFAMVRDFGAPGDAMTDRVARWVRRSCT